jgi:hypothetical protein
MVRRWAKYTDSFLLKVLEEGLARCELLCIMFDHCCCRCRHEGVAIAGALVLH